MRVGAHATAVGVALVCIVGAYGCSGGGGGGGGSGSAGTEVEPNDTMETATDLGGTGTHEVSGRACVGGDFGDDYFKFSVTTAGTITLALDWDPPDEGLLVGILDPDGFELDGGSQPPLSLEAAVTTTGTHFLELACFTDARPEYTGTLVVP